MVNRPLLLRALASEDTMSRHIADHAEPQRDPARLARALGLALSNGEAGPHPAIISLNRRAKDVPQDATRLAEFLRIDRGRVA